MDISNNYKAEFLPVSINISGKKLLIIGAGKVALQKIKSLSRFDASITVIGQEIATELQENPKLCIIQKKYEASDLDGFFMVYACTNSRETNEAIRNDCNERDILVNIADRPKTGDFVSPAIFKTEDITVSVGSNGNNPSKSVKIRNLIEEHLKIEGDEINLKYPGYKKEIHSPPLHQEIPNKKGKVVLAGFGPGDPGFLTLKTNQYLEEADLIFHDALLDVSYLDHFPAKKIPVGKRCGQHYKKQEEINKLLLDAALSGARVVRLKGGDPFVFGRGGEELEYLNRHQVDVEVIPGITSAFAAAAQFGIPLTHRAVASSVAFLVGYNLAQRPFPKANTLVFYMGAKHQCEISKALQEEGWEKSTPVALLSNISNPNSRAVISQLDQLCQQTLLEDTPLLIIVGETVKSMPDFSDPIAFQNQAILSEAHV
jgi:uroporphyrin-III C-methyltransferase/precorrin-2 dehydrogenase/sirohydrochlorin ferrochelatase